MGGINRNGSTVLSKLRNMATRKQVTCINKTNRTSAHERISHIGGSFWKYTEDDAIAYIKNSTYNFYVSAGGSEVDVIVATRSGKEYLKTKNDGEVPITY
jgi:hypothetical protein